jgi:toxoflavin biosynthesis protein ToxD
MRRNLWAGLAGVKQASALLAGSALALACGGAPQVQRRTDPYGERVSACIDMPRPLADIAQQRMIAIAGSPAVQGSTEKERNQARFDYGKGADARLFSGEAHVRRAYVHGFRMDASPVTNEQYAEFVAACGVLPPDGETLGPERYEAQRQRFGGRYGYGQIERFLWGPDGPVHLRRRHPMVLVSHDDAGLFCAWRGSRLPTEQEWERAARGVHGRAYPWGDRYDPFRVNTAQRGEGDTTAVGSLSQGNTEEGFTDMGGHVFEWTDTRAAGPPGMRVVKGNGWDGRGGLGRGAAKVDRHEEQKDVTPGFRCAADL